MLCGDLLVLLSHISPGIGPLCFVLPCSRGQQQRYVYLDDFYSRENLPEYCQPVKPVRCSAFTSWKDEFATRSHMAFENFNLCQT